MIKVTFCISHSSQISVKEFVKGSNEQLIPAISSLEIVQKNVRRFVVSYTRRIQSRNRAMRVTGIPLRKYDAIYDFWLDDFEAAANTFSDPAFIEIRDGSFNTLIDKNNCNVIISKDVPTPINEENAAVSGQKPKIRFTTLLIRNHSLTFEAFTKHHREKHMPIFASIPIIQKNVKEYKILQAFNQDIAGFPAGKYDGIVEFWFDHYSDMISVFINPKYLSKVRPDEKRFMEFNECDFIISRDLPPIIG